MHTVKVLGWQPYQLKEGPEHWDKIKYDVSDANLKYLRRFAPNLTDDKILARFVESPLDLERMNPHFWHGSAHAGAQSAAQTGPLRPMSGWATASHADSGVVSDGGDDASRRFGDGRTGTKRRDSDAERFRDFD